MPITPGRRTDRRKSFIRQEPALRLWQAAQEDEPDEAILIAPHLEARIESLCVFAEIEPTVRRLVACCRPPARFFAGVGVPGAADLAEASAQAGWQIEQFDTLVGRTRLLLSRANDADGRPQSPVESHPGRG